MDPRLLYFLRVLSYTYILPIFGIFLKIEVNFEICVPLERNLAMHLFMMLQEVGKCLFKKESEESMIFHLIVPRMLLIPLVAATHENENVLLLHELEDFKIRDLTFSIVGI